MRWIKITLLIASAWLIKAGAAYILIFRPEVIPQANVLAILGMLFILCFGLYQLVFNDSRVRKVIQ